MPRKSGTLADYSSPQAGIDAMRRRSIACESERSAHAAANNLPDVRRLVCRDCNCHDEGYMVEDHVWQEAHPEGRKGLLCLHCLEERLGRPLEAEDFTNALINLPILFGMRTAARSL